MIPTVREPEEERAVWGQIKEKCYFCKSPTIYWHWRTNQPVCPECSKKHKVAEIEKCHPDYKPPTKEQYLKST